MTTSAPITPKEYAADVLGGRRSPRWVRQQCRLFIRTKGRRGIKTISRRPYLIPVSS